MKLVILGLIFVALSAEINEFEISIVSPPFVANHFKGPLKHVTIMPGLPTGSYDEQLRITTLSNNKYGCRKYAENFNSDKEKEKMGILLVDSDNCSIATKIHYAQVAEAAALFLRYPDDNIQETEIDRSSFDSVLIPVFLLRNSDATKINDVLLSSDDANQLVLRIHYKSPLEVKDKRIRVFMSPQLMDNPMIPFLADLRQFNAHLKDFVVEVSFAVGYCKSCKDKGFLRKDPTCLSAGRYCVINAEFKTNELAKEAVRQICIRNSYPPIDNLIGYLVRMKTDIEALHEAKLFKEKDLASLSQKAIADLKMDPVLIHKCYEQSFLKSTGEQKADPDLDDNDLLRSEQKDFQEVNRYNIFPLVIVNGIYYDKSINVRDFVTFACRMNIFDCRGYARVKGLFVVALLTFSLLVVATSALFCRRAMRKKMESELSLKVNEAVQKYLTVEKS